MSDNLQGTNSSPDWRGAIVEVVSTQGNWTAVVVDRIPGETRDSQKIVVQTPVFPIRELEVWHIECQVRADCRYAKQVMFMRAVREVRRARGFPEEATHPEGRLI